MINCIKNKKGISTIEILVVIFILGVSLTSLLGLVNFSLGASNLLKQRMEADAMLQETIEAARNFRDNSVWEVDGLGVLTMGVSYYPQKTGDPAEWSLVLGEQTSGIFTRYVVFESVFRDANDNIASSGVEDGDTKKAVATVYWEEKNRTHFLNLTTYFTNWNQ